MGVGWGVVCAVGELVGDGVMAVGALVVDVVGAVVSGAFGAAVGKVVLEIEGAIDGAIVSFWAAV